MVKATVKATKEITLVMDEDVAETLLRVCMRVGGDPSKSRRKYMDEIATALYSAGVLEISAQTSNGAVYFSDEAALENEDSCSR